MGILISWPWLALIPAAGFFLLHRFSPHRLVTTTALLWLCYGLYEYGMYRRWLCSGECNIRVDLLLIYPALIALSLAAAFAAVRAIARRRRDMLAISHDVGERL